MEIPKLPWGFSMKNIFRYKKHNTHKNCGCRFYYKENSKINLCVADFCVVATAKSTLVNFDLFIAVISRENS